MVPEEDEEEEEEDFTFEENKVVVVVDGVHWGVSDGEEVVPFGG